VSQTVGYLAKRFPRLSETFILDEILGLEAAGVPLRVFALAQTKEGIVQPDVNRLATPVQYLHPIGGWRERVRAGAATLSAHTRLLVRRPRRYAGVLAYIVRRRPHLSTLRHFAVAGRLALLLEEQNARQLHAAFAHGPASVAHFVHLLTGLPFSFSAHAKDLYLSAPELVARKLAAAEFVLACSESAAATLRGLAGPGADKVVLALHGVDTSRFAPHGGDRSADGPGRPLRVLAVGRLVEKKGYAVLLSAVSSLLQGGRRLSCRVIGAGPCLNELEATTHRLRLGSAVTFLGARTHQEVARAYLEADVFVQASVILPNGDRDGIPNALLEAMASGLPVVASATAGIPEVVPPGCGLLVPPGVAGALAAALERLIDDPNLRDQFGKAARAHVVAHLDRSACARAIAPLFGARSVTPPLGVAS